MVVALLGVLIAPYFIDWSAYRADFEREASAIVGHKVVVRGTASARILPFPSVTFTDVVVEDAANSEKPLMTVAGFRMDAELAPYLSGVIQIFSMQLDRPHVRIPLTTEGALTFVGAKAALPTDATIVLDDVDIRGGSITVENGITGRVQELTDITAKMSARSLQGPFAGMGTLVADGQTLGFQLSSGPLQETTGLPFTLTVDAPYLDAKLLFEGSAVVAESLPSFTGSMRLVSPLPRTAASSAEAPDRDPTAATAEATAGLLPALDATSKLVAAPGSIELTDIRVAAGAGQTPYILTGSGAMNLARLPHFTLTLEGEQVDVDSLATGEAAPPAQPVTFEQRLTAMQAVLSAVPKPAMPGSVTIALPVVVAGDTTIRDVSFTASPTDTGWSLERFAAELPGRTSMEASGVVTLAPSIGFKGDLLVASRQPSGFAGWLTGSVDPAIRTLPQAGFSAKVELTPDVQLFGDLEVNIAGDTLRGHLQRSGPRDARALSTSLDAGRVDLDALLALSKLFTGEDDSIAEASTMAVKISAGPVTYRGVAAERIDADLDYDGSGVRIARLDLGNLAGANVKLSGNLGGFGSGVSAVEGSVAVEFAAADPAQAIEFLAGQVPPSPALDALRAQAPTLGPLALAGNLKTVVERPGEKPTLALQLAGNAAATAIKLDLALGNGIYARGTSGRFGLDLGLTSPDPAALLAQLGVDTLPLPSPSPLSVSVSLSAGATGSVAASAAVSAPGTDITAEGTFEVAATGITAGDFGVTARSDDISPLLMTAGVALGQSALDVLPFDLGGHVAFAGDTLDLRNFNGTLAGATVEAELQRQASGPLTGEVYVSDLSLPWLATLVYGRAAEPGADWPSDGFGPALLPPVDLALQVSADILRLGNRQAVGDFTSAIDVADGSLQLSSIQGTYSGGFVAGSAALRNANGVGGLALAARFSGLDLGTLALAGQGDAAQERDDSPGIVGTMDASLSLDGTGQSYAALVSSLTGAGEVSIEDGSFAGIRPGMFGPILEAADAEGFSPDTAATESLVAGLGREARYPVSNVRAEFTVAGGTARFAGLRLAGTGETLSGEAAIDLKRLGIDASLRLDLEPGDESVEGAEPSILYTLAGPLADPVLSSDVQPLASYLSVRAFEREQARVEAMQEALQERLRLRREARYYRWREAERVETETTRAATDAAELLRLDRLRREAERTAAEAAAAAAEATRAREAEAARQEQAARDAQAAAAAKEAARQAEARAAAAREAAAAQAARAEEARAEESAREAETTRARQDQEALRLRGAAEADRRAAETAPSPPSPPPYRLEQPVAPAAPRPSQDFPSLPGVNNPLDF
ncbi:hypothetical protein Sa4125_30890 [Aureimonas sp. SA4125]|uniref:AsmA-like C-terminal region-containing protein n=1 Tax=Aureimonas sp. SA4125 TaxID=2826993 RepID=UPI001CC5B5B4|nr:AsmA-like C-terminal region-containing protein [Aureimonas sp. SA4125]BDA85547.1 hypothetical protein Sa4125_30890 [Aureimonas sp. SA4125]